MITLGVVAARKPGASMFFVRTLGAIDLFVVASRIRPIILVLLGVALSGSAGAQLGPRARLFQPRFAKIKHQMTGHLISILFRAVTALVTLLQKRKLCPKTLCHERVHLTQ